MKPAVTVVDYGVGNLLSVSRGLEHCGAKVVVTSELDEIRSASKVVLPGVGAYARGMSELCRHGLDEVVKELAALGTPLLGICLGMQMLLDESEEFNLTPGLGLIPGRVVPVPATTVDGLPQKTPHIGWNALVVPQNRENWNSGIMQESEPGAEVYFVHSYMAIPENPEHRIADCIYGGNPISATIGRDNIYGCQFHPEKSGKVGLTILNSFVHLI